MSELELNGEKLPVDEDGFLQEPEKWSKAVAEFFAKHFEGIDKMSDDHWKLVNYVANTTSSIISLHRLEC